LRNAIFSIERERGERSTRDVIDDMMERVKREKNNII